MTVKTGMAMTEKGGMAMTAKRGTAGSGRRASVGRVSAGGRFGWPVGVCSAFTWPEAASGKRGSAGSRKNPLQRDAVRSAPRGWRAGASLAFASAGQPGRDADRRTRTRTPHNVRMGEQLRRRLGGGWPARGPATTAKRGWPAPGDGPVRADALVGRPGGLGLHLAGGGKWETRIGWVAQEPLTTWRSAIRPRGGWKKAPRRRSGASLQIDVRPTCGHHFPPPAALCR